MTLALGPVMRGVHAALAGRNYPVIVWGEEALRKLGARIPPGMDHELMLVLESGDMADAGARLQNGGFQHVPWSFGLDVERRTHMDAETNVRIMNDFHSFDMCSQRYVYRPGWISDFEGTIKVALIPAAYANISLAMDPAHDFEAICGFHWPKPGRLMISFIKTLVTEPMVGSWKHLLAMWAGFWLYHGKKLPDTIMDNCNNGLARRYFEVCIRPMQFAQLELPVGMEHQFVGMYNPEHFR
ncbi:unnamed protein product [Clonostachys solani]|uniref:Uncharacterized protein n=1 Tax=Clonostachys solani TaxID=160281 RepID=A0A9N9YZW2_9HYPO|nr:unnamed protein product [Clonostachys solani]